MVAVCGVYAYKAAVDVHNDIGGSARALSPRHTGIAAAGAVRTAACIVAVVAGDDVDRTAVLIDSGSLNALVALGNEYLNVIEGVCGSFSDIEGLVGVEAVVRSLEAEYTAVDVHFA